MDPKTIVLVDDDVDFLEITREVLETGGYRVQCFRDASAARRAMDGHTPDLVISDLMMDALHAGFSFAREIKDDARLANVPVILVTSVGSQLGFDFRPQKDADLAAMGVDAYLEKPVAPAALLAAVGRLLDT